MMLSILFSVLTSVSFAQWTPELSALLDEKLSEKTCAAFRKLNEANYFADLAYVKKNSKPYKRSAQVREDFALRRKKFIEDFDAECKEAIKSGITGYRYCGELQVAGKKSPC